MASRFRLALVAAAAAVAGSGAGASGTSTPSLTFRTLARGSEPALIHFVGGGSGQVPLGTWAAVVTSAGGLDASLGARLAARIDARISARRFVVAVFAVRQTRGYSVTIERLALERSSGGDVCVVASIQPPAPGRVVLQERTIAYHVVEARRRKGVEVPQSVVLRGPGGRLLYHTSKGSIGPHVCERS